MVDLATQAVDAINEVSGRHAGHRAVHAKGMLCAGTFTATPAAATLTTAAHLQGQTVAVIVRFSNASGNPRIADHARDGHGLAVKMELPDGGCTDIVAVDLPTFLVRTPEDFLAFTRAAKPIGKTELPGPRFLLFLATHHEAWRAVRAAITAKPLESWATCRYNALHAYKWVDAGGRERFVRYAWVPEAGEATISSGEAKRRGRDYLQTELTERLARATVRFALQIQIADDSDTTDDPTALWPDERETVTVGTLELTTTETGREQGGDVLVFDPTRVTAGIELSDDPILHFRSRAYSVSVERRSGISRPPELS